MRYLSVCSGIEAATVAWEPLGWQPAGFAEIEQFPCSVLKHHYPEVKNYGDFTTIRSDAGPIDLLVGGTPCQSFSVAGKRLGLDDPRGNLAIEFALLALRLRPRWLVWENVPGVLSSWSDAEEEGWERNDFDTFLALLGKCGYGTAYRVLDAQYFGVAQRRRRVFVVGHLGDWRPAAAVLFERESLSGDLAPCRKAGKGSTCDVAPSLTSSGRGVERTGESRGQDPVIAVPSLAMCLNAGGMKRIDGESETFIPVVSGTLAASGAGSDRPAGNANETDMLIAHALRADGFDASEDGTGRGTPLVPIGFWGNQAGSDAVEDALRSNTLGGGNCPAVAFQEAQTGCREYDTAGTLRSNGPGHDPVGTRVRSGMAVRRLTPRECERLQGFPDDYTAIPYRGKPAADGPRYKALGNSMAVPVMRWIGERIQAVEEVLEAAGR